MKTFIAGGLLSLCLVQGVYAHEPKDKIQQFSNACNAAFTADFKQDEKKLHNSGGDISKGEFLILYQLKRMIYVDCMDRFIRDYPNGLSEAEYNEFTH